MYCVKALNSFRVAPELHLKDLESLFRHRVLRMLRARGKVNDELIRRFMSLFIVLEVGGYMLMGQIFDRTGSYDKAYAVFVSWTSSRQPSLLGIAPASLGRGRTLPWEVRRAASFHLSRRQPTRYWAFFYLATHVASRK